MPHHISETSHKKDIYELLFNVAKTGTPAEIELGGQHLVISPSEKKCLDCLENHSDYIVGNPDDLVHIDWSAEWKTDL